VPVNQLAVGHLPGSAAAAIIGILAGLIYRSDLANLKSYRIPSAVVRFSTRFILPLIGSIRPPRRLNRALPDESRTMLADLVSAAAQGQNEEVITTAQPSAMSETGRTAGDSGTGESRSSVVREWVDELTGRAEQQTAGLRIPSEGEISQLTSMFPDVERTMVIGALQRRYVLGFYFFRPSATRDLGIIISPNIEEAVETLLSSQG